MVNKISGLIKRFGESLEKPLIQWYEQDGKVVYCGEHDIDSLWWEWVIKEDSKRYINGGYVVFEFGNPIKNPHLEKQG